FARNIRSVPAGAGQDLVDLIDEDDAGRLRALQRLDDELVLVEQVLELFFFQDAPRFGDGNLAPRLAAAAGQLLQVESQLLQALRAEEIDRAGALRRDFDLDLARIELAVAQPR